MRRAVAEFTRRDVDAAVELFTEDADLRPPSHFLDGIVFGGHAGLREWLERARETWREMEGWPHVVATVGDHVVTTIDTRLIGHESGVPIEQRQFFVFTLREGKIAAAIAYPSEAEALEAVGLTDGPGPGSN